MAFARVVQVMALLMYSKGIHGLVNNPTIGQNNIKQGFQSTANIKSVTDNLFQNDNLGRLTNFNSQNQMNSQQPSIPQSSHSFSHQLSLQQPQIISQLLNQQAAQVSDIQQSQSVLYQPQSSFIQQPTVAQTSSPQQQHYNFVEASPSFVPISNAGNINYQQQGIAPPIQQIPLQVSQSVPLSNTYASSYPSTSTVNTCGGQRMDYLANLNGNYVVPISTLPFSLPERQIVSPISTFPYTTVLSSSNPIYGNNVVLPYQNPFFGIYENPLNNFNEIALGNEAASLDFDNLISLLLTLLQSSKKSSKYLKSSSQGSSDTSFTPYKMNQGSKSSSLKALLPVILNLIKEKREGCGCNAGCKCNRNHKNRENFEIPYSEGYSKKRDYNLKEEMFNDDESAENNLRFIREHQKQKKTKNIPEASIESSENLSTDYDEDPSEEEDD